MLWVVIGHAFLGVAGEGPSWENLLFKFAYSFHMPLFMLISGYLFYLTRLSPPLNNNKLQWNYNLMVKDKLIRLLLPGVVFSIIATILKIYFSGEMSRQVVLSFNEIAHGYLYPNDNPMRELWFIVTLLWLFLLAPIWKFFIKKNIRVCVASIILVIMHFFHFSTEFLCLGRVFTYAVWFFLGIIISKFNIVYLYFEKNVCLTCLLGTIVYIIGYFTISFISTMGGIILSFGIALWADKKIPSLFNSFRNYTYQIFLVGIFAHIFEKIIYRHIAMPYIVGYILCILMGLYIPVLLSKLVKIINIKPLSLCIGLK